MEIKLRDLEILLSMLVLQAKEDKDIAKVALEDDCYWNIDCKDKFNLNIKNPSFNIGSLADDLQNINLVLANEKEPNFIDFERLANLLLYIAYAYSKMVRESLYKLDANLSDTEYLKRLSSQPVLKSKKCDAGLSGIEVDINDLVTLLNKLVLKVKDQGITKIALEDDEYWDINDDDKFSMYREAEAAVVGTLVNDLEAIQPVLSKKCRPSITDYSRLANLLVYVCYTLLKKSKEH